jgi:hypothetical protein
MSEEMIKEEGYVEALDEGMAMGRSVFMNIFGSPSMDNCRLQLHVVSEREDYIGLSHPFVKTTSVQIEAISGDDRAEGEKALAWIDQQAREAGFRFAGTTGSFWFQRKYERMVSPKSIQQQPPPPPPPPAEESGAGRVVVAAALPLIWLGLTSGLVRVQPLLGMILAVVLLAPYWLLLRSLLPDPEPKKVTVRLS